MEEKEKILNLLKHVIDPEIGINIVDLGLIYDIKICNECMVSIKKNVLKYVLWMPLKRKCKNISI